MPGFLIVLIHGGASSSRMYQDVTPLLERQGFSCLAPDLPGHGATAATTGPFTFATASDTIAKSIEQHQAASESLSSKVMLVGISLGAQAVLAFLQSNSRVADLVDSALVSGASIHPPDEKAQWEMPKLPTEQRWLDILTEDVNRAGMDNMQALQTASFGFTFELPASKQIPPTLAVVGEHDTTMSRRDLNELVDKLKAGNDKSDSLIMDGAWHNHSIDVPEQFTKVIVDWAQRTLS